MFGTILSALAVGLALLFIGQIHRENRVKLVICLIRPEQLGEVVSALKKEKLVTGMTMMNVRGLGRQGIEEETIRFLPKLKLEMLVRDADIERAAGVISRALQTGQIGDGKLFTLNVRAVMRIRTLERGIAGL